MSENNSEENREKEKEEKEDEEEEEKKEEVDEEDDDISLQENLDKYTQIDDLIREKKADIKVLNEEKKECEKIILEHLENKEVEYATWKNSKISRVVTKTKPAITGDILRESIDTVMEENEEISKEIKDEFADDILKEVEKNREPKEKVSLKRTFIKKLAKKPAKKKN